MFRFLKVLAFFLLFPCESFSAINASDINSDALRKGVEAYNNGDYETAEKLLSPYKGKLSMPDKILKIIALQKKKSTVNDFEKDIPLMREGKTELFDKHGFVYKTQKKAPVGMTASLALSETAQRAKKGNAEAAYFMALAFQDGQGVEKNMNSAVAYLTMAEQKKHPKAMNNLGFYYRFGIGVPQEEKKAVRLWREATLLKDPFASYNLARLYYNGSNKIKNMVYAYLFADLAYRSGTGKTFDYLRSKASDLKKKSLKKQTLLQKTYLKRYLPADMAVFFNKKDLNIAIAPKNIPALPENGKVIRETTFMTPVKNYSSFKYALKKNPEEQKDAELLPLLPPFFSYDETSPVNSFYDTASFQIPAPFPEDLDVLSAVYYRPALPRSFHLTLNKSFSGMPLMLGVTIKLSFHSFLHPTKETEKGANNTIKNTDYDIVFENKGVLSVAKNPKIYTIKEKTNTPQAWVVLEMKAVKKGNAVIHVKPLNDTAFGYTFHITVIPAPEKINS